MKKQSLQQLKKNEDASQRRKRVLIVDDDPSILDIYNIIFEHAGFSIQVTKNADDLLHNKFVPPDVFLIDKQLSGHNGLDICRHLKNKKETKDIPVIMISAAPDIAILAPEAGAEGYIEKPFEISDLLAQVNHQVNK